MEIDRVRQAGEARKVNVQVTLRYLTRTADRCFSDSVGNKTQGFVPIELP